MLWFRIHKYFGWPDPDPDVYICDRVSWSTATTMRCSAWPTIPFHTRRATPLLVFSSVYFYGQECVGQLTLLLFMSTSCLFWEMFRFEPTDPGSQTRISESLETVFKILSLCHLPLQKKEIIFNFVSLWRQEKDRQQIIFLPLLFFFFSVMSFCAYTIYSFLLTVIQNVFLILELNQTFRLN